MSFRGTTFRQQKNGIFGNLIIYLIYLKLGIDFPFTSGAIGLPRFTS